MGDWSYVLAGYGVAGLAMIAAVLRLHLRTRTSRSTAERLVAERRVRRITVTLPGEPRLGPDA